MAGTTSTVTHYRAYRNADSPALTALWNRSVSGASVAGPLSVHEFDGHVLGSPLFDPGGLVVAEQDGRPVGFAHAGFGPEEGAAPLRLSYAMGTVGMLVVDPDGDEPEVEAGLLAEAERYLRDRGSEVVYAGGQMPLNPFYWGVYGGSEWAGVLDDHAAFRRAVLRAGFAPVSTTVLLEADPSRPPEARDPRGVLLRRQVRLEVDEDAPPATWWESLAVGEFHPTSYRLVSRTGDVEIARASTWDMSWFGRRDGRARVGLYDLEVHHDYRRKGFGRHLIGEIFRASRGLGTVVLAVQTRSTNAPALAFYHALGFDPVGSATLYRKPGGSSARSG